MKTSGKHHSIHSEVKTPTLFYKIPILSASTPTGVLNTFLQTFALFHFHSTLRVRPRHGGEPISAGIQSFDRMRAQLAAWLARINRQYPNHHHIPPTAPCSRLSPPLDSTPRLFLGYRGQTYGIQHSALSPDTVNAASICSFKALLKLESLDSFLIVKH